MKSRLIAGLVRARLAEYPAVALLGPMQGGKTTLAKSHLEAIAGPAQPRKRARVR